MPGDKKLEGLLPYWTKRVITENTGRDPLGLSRVANLITDYLMTGIITQTHRARYYSLFSWILWHIGIIENPSTYDEFREAFQRRDAAIALASLIHKKDTPNLVGRFAATAHLEQSMTSGVLECNFRTLPANALGGYGQYYGSSLYHLGLTFRKEGGIDLPSKEVGEELAKLVHQNIQSTPYIQKNLFLENIIAKSDIESSAELLSIDAIQAPASRNERKRLIDLFFGTADKTMMGDRTLFRQHSLLRILDVFEKYKAADSPVREKTLDLQLLYGPDYFHVLVGNDGLGQVPFESHPKLQICISFWRQFCLHQYLTLALETILWCVLETAASESGGLTLNTLIGLLLEEGFYEVLRKTVGSDCERPAELLRHLGIEEFPNPATCERFRKNVGFDNKLSEENILLIKGKDPSWQMAKACLLLGVLFAKWRSEKSDTGYSHLFGKAGAELWAGNVLKLVDRWLEGDLSWVSVLTEIIQIMIIERHDRVMFEKKRLDSCWLQVTDGRITKEQDYSPDRRSSRHENAVSILLDLCLIQKTKDGILSLTLDGEQLLHSLLEGSQ